MTIYSLCHCLKSLQSTSASPIKNYSAISENRTVGQKCKNGGNDGTCVLVTDCEAALREINKRKSHEFKRCGFLEQTEIVCCPQTGINKFGGSTRGNRIADIECKKIANVTIPPVSLHILGGEEATIGEFPHMVALGFDRDGVISFDCGGSLLSPYYVLTAAHCVDNLDKVEPTMARLGVVDLGEKQWNDAVDHPIAEIIKHPNYRHSSKYDDLALLRLQTPVNYTNTIFPGCLYTSSQDPRIPLTVTGWGQTNITRIAKSNILLKANLTLVPREECVKGYLSVRKLANGITQEQLCAGDSERLRDTCQGDSGGPLQGLTAPDGLYRIIGVTSFGRACGSPYPGVYTRIYNYLDWIESIVWSNS